MLTLLYSLLFFDIMKKRVILFGNNNKNTLGKARSFGEIGYFISLIWVGPRYNLVRHSKYIQQWYNVNSIDEGVDLLLDKFSDPNTKTLVSIEGDGIVAAMDKKYNLLCKYFYFYNAGEERRLSYYLEKINLTDAAKTVGFQVPQTEILNVGELPKQVNYPIITKAIDSFDVGWKWNVFICHTEEDLLEAYKHLKCKVIVVQEFIAKDNELMLEGISVNRGEEVFLPIQGSFYRLPPGAYGSFGYFEEYNSGNGLYYKLKRLLQLVGYSGIFEAELLVSKNKELYFLEVNFRDTMWNRAFAQMGVNLNRIWADSEMSGHLTVGAANVISSPHLFMNEFSDYGRYVRSKKIKLTEWIKDFRRCNTYMVYDKTDIKPLIMYIIIGFLRKLERFGLARKDAHLL